MNLLSNLCVNDTSDLREALSKLDKNAKKILFAVDEQQKLVGILTDGDIRRALLGTSNLETSVSKVMNTNYVALSYKASLSEIQKALSEKHSVIPLIDEDGTVVDYSSLSKIRHMPILEPLLGGNELEYLTECIKTNWISSQGRFVTRFEEHVREYTGSEYALAVSNGTVALQLAMVALGIGAGDEVIVPNLTFAASINSIIHLGATPVIVDVDPDDWNISVAKVEEAITGKTKAIMPVHIYGVPCNEYGIKQIADKHGLFIVEDSAEALGAKVSDKHVGSSANASCYSFFGNKVITCGEGGAITFSDSEVYERARILRDHGMSQTKKYWHLEVGYNYRLTNLQAAVGCAQFEQLADFREKRKKIFSLYGKFLGNDERIKFQSIADDAESSYWLFTVSLNGIDETDRDKVIESLNSHGIDARPIFYPLADMDIYRSYSKTDCNNSREISYSGISLPTSVYLTEEDIFRVSNGLKQALSEI